MTTLDHDDDFIIAATVSERKAVVPLGYTSLLSWYTLVTSKTDKANPAEGRRRKATGPRFLRNEHPDFNRNSHRAYGLSIAQLGMCASNVGAIGGGSADDRRLV